MVKEFYSKFTQIGMIFSVENWLRREFRDIERLHMRVWGLFL